MIKPYEFKNEINHVKNTYELTIPETLVPIENPFRPPAPAGSVCILKKEAARRALIILRIPYSHTGGHFSFTGGHFWGMALLGRQRLSGLACHLQT